MNYSIYIRPIGILISIFSAVKIGTLIYAPYVIASKAGWSEQGKFADFVNAISSIASEHSILGVSDENYSFFAYVLVLIFLFLCILVGILIYRKILGWKTIVILFFIYAATKIAG